MCKLNENSHLFNALPYLKKVWNEEITFFYNNTHLVFALDDITHSYGIGEGATPEERAWVALNYMRYHRPWRPPYKIAREIVKDKPEYRTLMIKAMLSNKSLKPF